MDNKKAEGDRPNQREIWGLVRGSDIPSGALIIGGRFDLTLKSVGTPADKTVVRFIAQS